MKETYWVPGNYWWELMRSRGKIFRLCMWFRCAILQKMMTSFNLSHRKSATESPCQLFANNGPRQVGQQSNRVHVRFLTIAVVANPLITCGKEAATHWFHKGVSRHRKGICQCVSSPQVLLGRHQCAHQTLRCTSTPNNTPLPLWWILHSKYRTSKTSWKT